jgi:hypothetical protein
VTKDLSGGSRGGRKSERDDKLMEEAGEAGEVRVVLLTGCGTVRCLCSHPLLSLNCASGSVSGAKPSKTMCRLSIMREEGAGVMMSGPLVNGNNQTVVPFQFPFIVLLHG